MGCWGRLISGFLVFFTLFMAAETKALASSTTFNALFFQPATGRNPYLMLQGTDTLHQLQFDAGEMFSYGFRPLEIRDSGTRVRGVIDHTVVADFVAAIGAMEWLQFGIDFPLILINQFRDPLATPAPSMSNQFDIGDLRFEGKARFIDCCSKYVGIAVIPFITFPTGKDSHYVGDPGFGGGGKVAIDGRFSEMAALTLNLGYRAGRRVLIRNIDYQHRMILGGGFQLNLKHGIDVTAEVNAESAFNKFFTDRDMNPAEAMVGFRWDVMDTGVSIQGGGGTCLVCGVKGARIRAALGAKYALSTEKLRKLDQEYENTCRSRFGKGMSIAELRELKMKCPEDPSQFQAGVHDEECPKYYELREMADLVLRCPERPEDFNPRYHDASCPKVFELREMFSQAELQNIYDLAAAEMTLLCPASPADFNPQIHDMGCPKYYELQDTLSDADRMSIVTLAGLDEAERMGISGGEIRTRPVYFDFNRAELRPDAMMAVDEAIASINKASWVMRVRVGGHADARGTIDANELISMKRAQAVINYMRSHGVRPDVELLPIAYGDTRPAASNTTEDGRTLNRRVIFTVVGARFTPVAPPKAGEARGGAPGEAPPTKETEIAPAKSPKRWEQ